SRARGWSRRRIFPRIRFIIAAARGGKGWRRTSGKGTRGIELFPIERRALIRWTFDRTRRRNAFGIEFRPVPPEGELFLRRDERGRVIDNRNSPLRFHGSPGLSWSLKGVAPAFPIRLKRFSDGVCHGFFNVIRVPETNFALCRMHVYVNRFRIHLQ